MGQFIYLNNSEGSRQVETTDLGLAYAIQWRQMQNPASGKEFLVRIHAGAEKLGTNSVGKALVVLVGSKLNCQQWLKVY